MLPCLSHLICSCCSIRLLSVVLFFNCSCLSVLYTLYHTHMYDIYYIILHITIFHMYSIIICVICYLVCRNSSAPAAVSGCYLLSPSSTASATPVCIIYHTYVYAIESYYIILHITIHHIYSIIVCVVYHIIMLPYVTCILIPTTRSITTNKIKVVKVNNEFD